MNKSIIYGIAGLVIGILITSFIMSNSDKSSNNFSPQQNMMQDFDGLDAHFIEQMIPHHEDAITMAKIAQTKAQKPEIKQLAENIIDSQGREIDQMKSWYKDWFGTELPTGTQIMGQHGMRSNSSMHMGMMGDETDIGRLEQTNDFDKAFVEEMIPHHQMAVMMATMLKNGTNRSEMEKLADDIIIAQTKEIDQMRQWYRDWGY